MKSRVSDSVKVQQWAERLKRYGDCGQTVAEFCRAERVSQPSFYQWKKRLGFAGSNGRAKTGDRAAPAVRANPPGNSHGSSEGLQSIPSTFQAVELSEPSMKPQPSSRAGRDQGMTVRFGPGIEIEIGSDLRVVETVMRQLLDASVLSAGGSSC